MDTMNFTITRDDLTDVIVEAAAKEDAQGCYDLTIEGQSQGQVCFHIEDKYQFEFIGEYFSYREEGQIVTQIQQTIS
jgi:hypothetical protein